MPDAADQRDNRGQSFRCPACRASMRFDAAEQTLLCDHCGNVRPIERRAPYVVARDLAQGLSREGLRGFGAELRVVRCDECGASVAFGGLETAKDCDFCGSAHVLEQREHRNVLRPESLVPFAVDRREAAAAFSRWLGALWLRPCDLAARASVTEIAGVYVPYWTFDAVVASHWTAEAGWHYSVTETEVETDEDGNEHEHSRQVQRTRWEPAWGGRTDRFRDELVCASRGLPERLARRLSNFDARELKPYAPEYLAGWRAEEYCVSLDEAWSEAAGAMEAEQQRRCAADVPGDTHRRLSVSNRFFDERFKHVLLPVWISAYRYKGKVYRFLVNGQTGEVAGKAPLSPAKVAVLLGAIAALIAAIVLWFMLR